MAAGRLLVVDDEPGIAERRISRSATERLHLLPAVASMGERVMVTDDDGLIRLANPAFRQPFGVAGEASGRSPLELTRLPEVEDLVVGVLRAGEVREVEIEVRRSRPRGLSLTGSLLSDGSGAMVVARDVTELARVSRMRRDFVVNVSGELKTPLSAIRGYAETLADGTAEDPSTAARSLDRILQQCDRLQAPLEDLLTLSRLESLDAESRREPVPPDEAVRECVEMMASRLEERAVELDIEAEAQTLIAGDWDAMERLSVNLLDNAVKSNRRHGPISIRVTRDDGEELLEVADSRIGEGSTSGLRLPLIEPAPGAGHVAGL